MAALDGTRRERRLVVMPELPLDHTPEQRGNLLKFARRFMLRAATIFYDAIPWKMRDIYPAVLQMLTGNICLNSMNTMS